MPIPTDRIETPEIVWATFDDTLEDARQRLQSPKIEEKWQAYILVRSDEGQYAVASVFDLRPMVWEEGPAALKRPLRDVGLFQLQPGVEQDSLDWTQATQRAGQYGGYLVVLRNGRYIGLIREEIPRRADMPPSGAFDFFDKLLPDAVLDQTEFIVATLNTTVARVARDLKALRDPENAYIVVESDDEAFLVMAARDLDAEVKRFGADVWPMALRQFGTNLKTSVQREHGTVGHKQAQAIADRENFLILTDEGEPKGLLPGKRVTRRSAGPRSKGLAHNLFDVPEEGLSGFPDELDLGDLRYPREVLPRFEHKGEPIGKNDALVYARQYQFKLAIGKYDESKSELPAEARQELPVIPPDEEGGSNLYVSLFSDDLEFEPHTQALWLPTWGDSAEITFDVTPVRRTVGAGDLVVLTVCIYYRCNIVQVLEMSTPVVTSTEEAKAAAERKWTLQAARTKNFVAVQDMTPKELSLVITKKREDNYLFTFSMDPDEVEETEWKEIRLGCRINLTRAELTHLITKARRQLYNVVQVYDLIQAHDQKASDKSIRALAQVGRQLHQRLFRSQSAKALEAWMKKSLPLGSTIQIVNRAKDFVFPWSLIYEASPWDDDEPIDVEEFWGARYKLAICTDELVDTYGNAGEEIKTEDDLRIVFGLYERLTGADEQYDYFSQLGADPVDHRRAAIQALKQTDSQLIYFFCHGYTEKMASDIQWDENLVREFVQSRADRQQEGDHSLAEHLDDLFDVSDSWMRLTWSKLPLTMLREELEDMAFASHPLVFLNMCQSAQVLPSLSDGLIPFFIEKGARGVLGTECSMNMIFGDRFARAFLDRFFEGKPAAEILWKLRQQFLRDGDPLALAYTLFGDADLRLKRSDPTETEGP